jgi:two-component system, chemotaxis family, chemotaxis protein CheY
LIALYPVLAGSILPWPDVEGQDDRSRRKGEETNGGRCVDAGHDHKTMLCVARNLLKKLDFEDIGDMSDGTAALHKMREKKNGLMISDWNMEPMTGSPVAQVGADRSLTRTAFIIVTAESETENVIAAKRVEVNNYIVRSFNAQQN